MTFTDSADLEQRLAARLDPLKAVGETEDADSSLIPAAVLVPIVARPGGWTLLLTQRAAAMPTHAGQIAFPGGRIQREDASPMAAALRETFEEVGLSGAHIRLVGTLPALDTITGYSIVPVVGLVAPDFSLVLDAREVECAFEAPLDFLLDPANHQRHQTVWRGAPRFYYAMPWGDRYIWGATAGIIRALYERLYW